MTDPLTSNSVFDMLRERATGMERSEGLWQPPVSFSTAMSETGQIEPMGFATRKEYELSATVVARFWANRAQVDDCRKVALRSLSRLLYGDVLRDLDAIQHAIFDGDPKGALAHLSELRDRLTR